MRIIRADSKPANEGCSSLRGRDPGRRSCAGAKGVRTPNPVSEDGGAGRRGGTGIQRGGGEGGFWPNRRVAAARRGGRARARLVAPRCARCGRGQGDSLSLIPGRSQFGLLQSILHLAAAEDKGSREGRGGGAAAAGPHMISMSQCAVSPALPAQAKPGAHLTVPRGCSRGS